MEDKNKFSFLLWAVMTGEYGQVKMNMGWSRKGMNINKLITTFLNLFRFHAERVIIFSRYDNFFPYSILFSYCQE